MTKAKTIGNRVIILCEGTKLVPTHDFVTITDKEANDTFTRLLTSNNEVIVRVSSEQEPAEEPELSELEAKLSKLNKEELSAMLDDLEIGYSSRDSKNTLIAKLIEYEQAEEI